MTRLWVMSFFEARLRTCLKNHSRNLHAPLCGIFCPDSVVVARYGNRIQTKSPTNCDAHLAESLFQPRSKTVKYGLQAQIQEEYHEKNNYHSSRK